MPDVTLSNPVDTFLICLTQAAMRAALGTLTATEIASAIATAGLSIGSTTSPLSGSTLAAIGQVDFLGTGTVTISPSNTVTISPGGILVINPASVSTMNNVNIGATVRGTGAFTTLAANAAVTLTANTASTGVGSGTLVVTGGTSVSGALYIGGRFVTTVAAIASTPPAMFSGALFSGGTGTTTQPHVFIQPSTATAVTTWNTAGTFFGVNSATGFTGNFLDFRVNGAASGFVLTYQGVIQNATLGTGCVVQWHETVVVSAKGVDATSGTNKAYFDVPFAVTLNAVQTTVDVAPTGSTLIVDIKKNGTTIFSTRSSIDATEVSTATAAVPSVISTPALAAGDRISFNLDQVGSTVAGQNVIVTLRGTRVLP